MRRALLISLAAAALAACHPPRSPREIAEGSVTGWWTAVSAASGEPRDTGRAAWRLSLEQREAGRLAGRGSLSRAGDSATFTLAGLRAETEINLELHLPGGVRFHGSIADPRTLVGEMAFPDDTLPVTFTRE